VRLEASRTSVTRVICERQGRTLALRARHVVLALGALLTPVLLMNSATAVWPHGLANDSDQVGRNLMRHFSEMFLVRTRNGLRAPGQVKEISFNDFYLPHSGTGREKLGNVQSFGRIPPADVAMNGLPHFWRAFSPLIRRLWRLTATANVLVGIMEDLPYADNRVLPGDSPVGGPSQRIRLEYRPQSAERRRMRAFRRCITESLRPYRSIAFRTGADNTWIAHSCGTCRFGTDPARSVLDRHNRAHGLDNLYVVDASFFPSSGGINPGLTIAANALRIAAHLNERF
jgi:choline dehydrogenase-like flavoprotein